MAEEDSPSDSRSEDSPTRRAVLRGGVATLGTTLAASGGAAADSERVRQVRELRQKYENPETVEETVKRFSESTASAFADTDPAIAEAVSSVNTETVHTSKSPGDNDADEGTYLSVFKRKGTFTAHITRLKHQEGVVIKHVVQPEVGRSYVLLKSPDGELLNVVDQSTELTTSALDTESIEASGCESQGYECPPGCCNLFPCKLMEKYERFCCRGVADGCYEENTGYCCDPLFCC